MGIALGTVLVLGALAVLIYPFINRRRYSLPADPRPERLRAARVRVYRQIADLQADHEAGELTGADFEQQLAELRLVMER